MRGPPLLALLLASSALAAPAIDVRSPEWQELLRRKTEEAAALDATAEVSAKERGEMSLCRDGRGRHYALGERLYMGDGKSFTVVLRDGPLSYLPSGSFLDPRFNDAKAQTDYNGVDLRRYSRLYVSKKGCSLDCGDRSLPLTLVPAAEARALLEAATFAPSPRKWRAHALARDNQGRYFYVDRALANATSFRLFIGPKGNLGLQRLKNVVSDSEGQVFATTGGSLRLVLGKAESVWIAKKKSTPLLWIPVADNLMTIHNELGVYAGERLGTPCDDL